MKTRIVQKLIGCFSLIFFLANTVSYAQIVDKDALKGKLINKVKEKKNNPKTEKKEETKEEKPETPVQPVKDETKTTPPTNQVNNNTTKTMSKPIHIQVKFSGEPFVGDAPTNTLKSEFKAWEEIYGRIEFGVTVKEFLSGLEEELLISDGKLFLDFTLLDKATNEKTHVWKYIYPEEMDKPYIDFDVAPSSGSSRDAYSSSFGNGLANQSSTAFENREKTTFVLNAFFQSKYGSGTHVEVEAIEGTFTLNYANIEDGDPGRYKLLDWGDKISQAGNEYVVKENKKKMAKQPTIFFSNTPFSTGNATPKKTFKAGETIYGRIKLNKTLGELVKEGETAELMNIEITCLNGTVYGIGLERFVRKSEFANDYIDFDVCVPAADAKDVCRNNGNFSNTFYAQTVDPSVSPMLKFEVSLATDYNINYNHFRKIEAFGNIEIDYTGTNKAKLKELHEKGLQAAQKAEENAFALDAKENNEWVKKNPMPVAFSRGQQPGYTSYSNAQIINMIKIWYKVNEVYMLTFDKPEAAGDFSVWKDDSGYPTEKRGNHYFYFVFKDTDGYYKMAGGVLSLPYAGGGSYGDPIIIPYAPYFEGDVEIPFDKKRKKDGYEGVLFFDGNKVKK